MRFIISIVLLFFLVSCKKTYTIPQDAISNGKTVEIYPDYKDVSIPFNIAPLNFIVKSAAENYVVAIKSGQEIVLVSGGEENGVIKFDSTMWRKILTENKEKSLTVDVYEENNGEWTCYNSFNIYIAKEEIDAYLSYRLIEPGYELYRQLGLYQRNLTNFTQNVIYENNREDIPSENHCVNCHNYQNYGGDKMLFHIRANMGGTLIAKDGKIEKLNFKNDSILGAAVYPSWHPKKNYIVFSSNKTGQAFHTLNNEKIEVMDYGSDLLFYNVDTHEVSNIFKGGEAMETFPTWSPDGRKIYFCRAITPGFSSLTDSMKIDFLVDNYKSIYYDVMSVEFDNTTMSFSNAKTEVDCSKLHKSASVPRVSPDGKYLLFTLGDYGQFHIWHKSSDLWVKNLETAEIYPLEEANSEDVDSYHSWSSNGRWIVFSSRRDDGSYTRPYISYFDKNGKSHKAFMLPQEDPEYNLMLLKSYNVPELTKTPVKYTPQQFREAIYGQNPGVDIKYKSLKTNFNIPQENQVNSNMNADAVSGASYLAK